MRKSLVFRRLTGDKKERLVLRKTALTIFSTLSAPCVLESCIKVKINLNFYFHSSLRCLKRFYEGLSEFVSEFWECF